MVAIRDFFGASDLDALPGFQCANEMTGFQKTGVRSRIQPRDAAARMIPFLIIYSISFENRRCRVSKLYDPQGVLTDAENRMMPDNCVSCRRIQNLCSPSVLAILYSFKQVASSLNS